MSFVPERARIIEIGPCAGLQNESTELDTASRVALIEQLANTGLQSIECGAFSAPRSISQVANSERVLQTLTKHPGCRYAALAPSVRGLQDALAAGADAIVFTAATSESFSRKHMHGSIAECLERYAEVCQRAQSLDVPVRGYVACIDSCPYEGSVEADKVVMLATEFAALGCVDIVLSDSTGTGTPLRLSRLIERVSRKAPLARLAVHFCNTYGQALANTHVALQMGIATMVACVAGLGQSPFKTAASGNLATEDLVYMLHGLGVETGIDLEALVAAAWNISHRFGRRPDSRVARAMASEAQLMRATGGANEEQHRQSRAPSGSDHVPSDDNARGYDHVQPPAAVPALSAAGNNTLAPTAEERAPPHVQERPVVRERATFSDEKQPSREPPSGANHWRGDESQ